ncbi:unnamed protein product [Rotaria sp. Silwood2]|nr:unnamed protein product [Rotaria sp. Silwood2]
MLLVESSVRSYLTHFRSIYSSQHHLTEKDLCHLLKVFTTIDIPLSDTNSFIHSILYDSNSDIQNFVAKRQQFLQITCLEQARKQDDNLVFHWKYDEKTETTNVFTLSSVYSTSNTKKKDGTNYFDETSPNDTNVLSTVTLHTNNKNTPCYLSFAHYDPIDRQDVSCFDARLL